MVKRLLTLTLILLMASCSSHHQKMHEPENLGLVKQRVKAWINSDQYPAATSATYKQIRKDLEELSSQKSNVKYALIFDIDETVLSNKIYYERTDFGFVRPLFEKWLNEERCDAIPGSLELYKWAKANHFAAFFITGREQQSADRSKDRTIINLKKVGFTNFDGIYFKPKVPGKTVPVIEFKGDSRCDVEHHGYKIAAVIGDQYSDLKGSCLGLKTYKIPNPVYFIPDGGRPK